MSILDILPSVIAVVSILATTMVAVKAIGKTAIENRVSNIHTEMTSCIIETVFLLNKVISLLREIANKVFYLSIPEGKQQGNAYNRYWEYLGEYSATFQEIQAKQRIVFPKDLYNKCQELLIKLNEARNVAKDLKPNENNKYPDTSHLIHKVNDAVSLFNAFLNVSRRYSGADKLEPIIIMEDIFLQDNITRGENPGQ